MLRLAIAIPVSREPPYGRASSFGIGKTQLIRGQGTVATVGVVATPAPTSNVTVLSESSQMRNGSGAC